MFLQAFVIYILPEYNKYAYKYLVWYISDKNQIRRAMITNGLIKFMTDCKHVSRSIYFKIYVSKNAPPPHNQQWTIIAHDGQCFYIFLF